MGIDGSALLPATWISVYTAILGTSLMTLSSPVFWGLHTRFSLLGLWGPFFHRNSPVMCCLASVALRNFGGRVDDLLTLASSMPLKPASHVQHYHVPLVRLEWTFIPIISSFVCCGFLVAKISEGFLHSQAGSLAEWVFFPEGFSLFMWMLLNGTNLFYQREPLFQDMLWL